MKRVIGISLLAVIAVSVPLLAHGQKGPHGGQMILSGSHRFEMVVGDSQFEIYVINLKKQVLPLTGVSGSATIHSNNDKKTDNVSLTVSGDHLVGDMNIKKLRKAEVHVKIVVDGKEAAVAFEYPPD
jgi:hypothetical protein